MAGPTEEVPPGRSHGHRSPPLGLLPPAGPSTCEALRPKRVTTWPLPEKVCQPLCGVRLKAMVLAWLSLRSRVQPQARPLCSPGLSFPSSTLSGLGEPSPGPITPHSLYSFPTLLPGCTLHSLCCRAHVRPSALLPPRATRPRGRENQNGAKCRQFPQPQVILGWGYWQDPGSWKTGLSLLSNSK